MDFSSLKRKWLNNELDKLQESGLSKAQIARQLDILPQQLNNILNGSRGISDNFIDKFISAFSLSQIDLFHNEGSLTERKIIPLIPLEAFAGYPTEQFSDMPIEEYYQINEFSNADFLIRVKGDSMTPKYNGGDLVACKKIQEITFFQWHRIYVVYTKSQGIVIKRVEPAPTEDCIELVSDNPAYKPFLLKKEEIDDIAIVLGAVTLE